MTETIVTGASGFIGSHLMKRLPNAKPLCHHEIGLGGLNTADKLFFLSTYGNMAHHSVRGMMVQANVVDLIHVIKIGFKGWLCYMSSSSVTLPVQTPYSRTKRAAEEILQALPELKSCIVRPYSVTGVGEQKEHLIPTLIRSCMEGEEIPFDPNPVHDFVDVEDVVKVLIELSDSQATGIIEIGRSVTHTNDEVRKLVERETGRKANIKERIGLRSYDNAKWRCKEPSFYRMKTLNQSITEMVEAYKREH